MLKKIIHIILLIPYSLFTIHAFAQQTEKVYLSGTGSNDTKQWEFMCTAGMNANKWTTIAVPSCWELQGFGKYDYGFVKDSGKGKEKGLYKYHFNAPATWKGKMINIVFEGVMTDAEVKVNGKSAGAIHQGAFYAFKYDITKLLKYGKENLVEVTVAKHSSNQSVNEAERKADFWVFGGIFRPVWLEVLPETHIRDANFSANSNGEFICSFSSNRIAGINALVEIYDERNMLIDTINCVDVGSNWSWYIGDKKIKSPKLWSPEFPNRYKAVFTIFKGDKKLHQTIRKFGFRTVELKQRDGIYINGVKVKMKGVNRSPFRPETGRTLSKEQSIEDVLLIKDMNMNAVRCSHYPPDDHFLNACDSLGLFVMDELAGWHGNYDTKTGTKLLKEMIDHDANHPSIVMWANGNEGGHNFELDSLFTQYDKERPLVHPWQLFSGIETQHYREYNYGIGNYEYGKEILMPTEFLHGQFDGGHGAGLEDYWEKMWHDPLSAGGFLWDFADQAVVRKDKNDSLDTDKHRAADGIVGPHHEKEGSYFAIKEIWSPVHFEKREITDAFDGTFNIENRYHYTNINTCSFSWKLKRFDVQSSEEKAGTAVAPDIRPNTKGTLQIPLPANWKDYDVLYVTATDQYQKELFTWSFPVSSPVKTGERMIVKEGNSKIETPVADTNMILVKVNDLFLMFNESNGMLAYVKNKNGVLPFNNGPIVQEGTNNFKGIKKYWEGDKYIIESTYDKKESYNTLKWTIYPSGWIQLQVNYFPGAYHTNFAGINFSFPETEIKSVTYMGNGPYRVWKNRMKGGQFGVWNKTYNNTETGEAPWNYPEFKGYYSNFYGGYFFTKSNRFTVVAENENMFLRLFTPAWKTDQWHNYEPLFPSGDISFMQGISSIGSKTQRNETTGPMGMKNIFYDYEKDPARALKLVLYFNFN